MQYPTGMAKSKTPSGRLNARTRQILAEAAAAHDAAGASALDRDSLEDWAATVAERNERTSIQRAVSYLRVHADGWGDDPAGFFPRRFE